MKVLKLKNGYEINGTDSSTIDDIVTVTSTFAEIDEIRSNFTASNLLSPTFDELAVADRVPMNIVATTDGKNIVVHIHSREKSDLEKLKDMIEEQGAAIEDLAAMVAVTEDGTEESTTEE